MNRLYIFGLIVFYTNIGLTQSNGIGFAINDSNTGTGLHFNYVQKIKERISFGGGIRIHINPEIKRRRGATFDHTFYAKNINQRIGLNAFFEYEFKKEGRKINPFVGYHAQVLSTARKVIRFGFLEPVLYEWDSPLTVWNNMLVFGVNYNLSEKLSLKYHSGLGFSSIYDIDKRVILGDDRNPYNNSTGQFNVSFNLGAVYWFI